MTMKSARPGALAIRAANQYRRRDILPYLGLRYYLENNCARRDRWTREVASHLVVSRTEPVYLSVLHFKEHIDGKDVEHRRMHFPGPNEALVESHLLNECSWESKGFKTLPSVFSYRFARSGTVDGIFETYFTGYRERHEAVASACINDPTALVLYTDIKRFYPTITRNTAWRAWSEACDESEIEKRTRECLQTL